MTSPGGWKKSLAGSLEGETGQWRCLIGAPDRKLAVNISGLELRPGNRCGFKDKSRGPCWVVRAGGAMRTVGYVACDLVRSRRLELPRGFPHKHLKLARLPFRHDRNVV